MTVLWKKTKKPVSYAAATAEMDLFVEKIAAEEAPEMIWLLEHPPLYTIGTSGHVEDIFFPEKTPVFISNRGGKVTYHGPGQRVGYVMLNLKKRKIDLRQYVRTLEAWLIDTLKYVGVRGMGGRQDRIGVWVSTPLGEAKIAAIGIRIRKGVSFHGFSLNIHPDLTYFQKIRPCGLENFGVTSLQDLGLSLSMDEIDAILREKLTDHFSQDLFLTPAWLQG